MEKEVYTVIWKKNTQIVTSLKIVIEVFENIFKTFILWYTTAFVKKISLHKIIRTKLHALLHTFFSSCINYI